MAERKTVLVVDSDEASREALSGALRRDYRVLRTATGESAIHMAEREGVDVMLLDVTLPGISAIEVLKIFKENYPHIAVVVTSPVEELTVAIEELPDRLTIGDIMVSVVDQPHGSIESAGLRFDADNGSIGYATDLHAMTEAMRGLYTGLDVWIVDALRRRPHPTHPDLATALGWIAELAPARAALVHMDHSMDYATLRAELPPGVEPGFDGLELTA